MKNTPRPLLCAASDLVHPLLVRMPRDPGYVDASAFQMEEEQHIIGHQPSPAEHLNREEITPRQHVHMSGEKVLPGGDLASFGSRSNAMPAQYILHGLIRQ